MMQTKKLHQLSEEVKMHTDRVKLTTFDAAQAEALDMMAGDFLGHVEEVQFSAMSAFGAHSEVHLRFVGGIVDTAFGIVAPSP